MRIPRPWRPLALATTVLCAWLCVSHVRSQQQADTPADAPEKAEFYWSRLRYTSADDFGGGRGYGFGYRFAG